MTRARWTLVAVIWFAGCEALPPHRVRFANAPPIRVVDDRREVAAPPSRTSYLPGLYHYEGIVHQRVVRGLELERSHRALGVNALDEVPDSTWFTNRIGVRTVTPDEVRAGAVRIASPEAYKPWVIRSTKVGGNSVGFVIEDSRHERFLLKFDQRGYPELQTTAQIVTSRLLWACGYNVTADQIVYFRPTDWAIAPDAVARDGVGREHAMTAGDVAEALAKVEHDPDGRIRAIASHLIPGTSLGGHPRTGVRAGDPNDRIPHERRRDLRGAFAMFAWLDHGDLNESQSLDSWGPDPADPRRHYVTHYLLDFDKTLGVMAVMQHDLRRGWTYIVDFADLAHSFVTLGMAARPWQRRAIPRLHGIGLYDVASYDPARWHPDTPSYTPILASDRFDKFWGAKLVVRFTHAQLRAAVEAARLSDPAAAAYLTEALLVRARETARYWFSQVSPLDRVAISDERTPRLCFDDLMLTYGLAAVTARTRYVLTSFDGDGRALGAPAAIGADPRGRSCGPLRATAADGYTIVRIETRRPGFSGRTYAHVARDPTTNRPRVIGLWRE